MKTLGLIIQREFYTRVKKVSFIVMTLAVPFLLAALMLLPMLLMQIKDSEVKTVVVLDRTGLYASHFKSMEGYQFEVLQNNPSEARPKANGGTFGLLEITDNLNTNPQAATVYSEKQVPTELLSYMNKTLNEVTKQKKLNQLTQDNNVDQVVIQSIQQILEDKNNVSINTIRWDEDGAEKQTSVELASAIGFALVMFMYMFILTYGAMVMQGVIEEKTNRIVEVMISSVKPFDLMMGKIIGIGLVGFLQLTVWISMGAILIGFGSLLLGNPSAASGTNPDELMTYLNMLPHVNWLYILSFFILFFIGGYLIYASIFAMFASAVDNAQDTQQFVTPITLIFIFALYAGMSSVQNPDGPLAFWCSMIPFTSPMVMMVRIPADIPLWETLLSLAILYTSTILTIKFAAKIYRVGILMYGKKPTVKELYKWFKYK